MRIIAGGIGKTEVVTALKPLLGADDTVTMGSDMDAALKLRTGQVDFYLGTCHTGAGASLGVLVGLLGSTRCHTFGRRVPTAEEMAKALTDGKVAYGFAIDQIVESVPVIWNALDLNRH